MKDGSSTTIGEYTIEISNQAISVCSNYCVLYNVWIITVGRRSWVSSRLIGIYSSLYSPGNGSRLHESLLEFTVVIELFDVIVATDELTIEEELRDGTTTAKGLQEILNI